MNPCSLRKKDKMSNRLGIFEDKIRECGFCGEFFSESEMEPSHGSPTGWVCCYCLWLMRREKHGKKDN